MLSYAAVQIDRLDYYVGITTPGQDGGLREPDGRWLGQGASELGLDGPVTAADARAVLRGRIGGQLLLPQPDRRTIAAFDLTFSVPKSVSLLFAFASPEISAAVLESHDRAVTAALGWLEGTSIVGRAPGGGQVSVASGMVAMSFVHRASRAPDPHLHSHVLVANFAYDRTSEQQLLTLDARDLFAAAPTLRALYDAHLRYELTTTLGVVWGPLNGRTWADLAEIGQPKIDAFSTRRNQIREYLPEALRHDPRALRAAADDTRPRKDLSVAYEQMLAKWIDHAHALGLPQSMVDGVVGRARPAFDCAPGDPVSIAAERSVTGTFTDRELLAAVCMASPQGITVTAAVDTANALAKSGRVQYVGSVTLSLHGGPTGRITLGHPEPVYTSHEVIESLGRISRLAAERPAAVGLLAYGPAGRAEAFASVSSAAGAWLAEGREVVAYAPTRYSAASFEALTGIDTLVQSDRPQPAGDASRGGRATTPYVPRGGVVILAEAASYRPQAIEVLLEACAAANATFVALGPATRVSRSTGLRALDGVAAAVLPGPALAGADLSGVALAGAGVPSVDLPSVDLPSVDLPGVDLPGADLTGVDPPAARRPPLPGGPSNERELQVTIGTGRAIAVPDLRVAVAAVARLSAETDPGHTVVVVSDQSLVQVMEAVLAATGTATGAATGATGADPPRPVVVHANHLKDFLEDGPVDVSRAVVLGGSAILRQRLPHRLEVAHVVVAPELAADAPEGLTLGRGNVIGRVAQSVRPAYLRKELGPVPAGVSERGLWRAGATVIEGWREKWQMTDDRSAFGREAPDAARPETAGLRADLTVARLEVARISERLAPGRRRSLEMGR